MVNLLRSALTLAHLIKLCRQVSKLDQLVTIQFIAKNNHQPSVHYEITPIFDGKGQTAICHRTEDQLLHHMNVETEDNCVNTIGT
jgi:hypothetical protein